MRFNPHTNKQFREQGHQSNDGNLRLPCGSLIFSAAINYHVSKIHTLITELCFEVTNKQRLSKKYDFRNDYFEVNSN